MIIEHRGKTPTIHPTATIAPTAVLCGDVTIGPESCVLFGAVISAEGGPVVIGSRCVIMEHAVVRATPNYPTEIGDNVLVGPHAHLTGCTVGSNAFLATGCAVFTGATIGTSAEVRIHAIVHLKTALPANATVPIGWVAVGDPAHILPPDQHDEIWAIQKPLDFPGTVFGLGRDTTEGPLMPQMMARYTRALARHQDDRILDPDEPN